MIAKRFVHALRRQDWTIVGIEFALVLVGVQRPRQVERAAIDAALQRIDESEFGYCVVCGEKIPEAQLLHNPAVSTRILFARKV